MHIFEVIDKTGRVIYLTRERLQHLAKHPEIIERLEDIKQVLQHPLKITVPEIDKPIAHYYKFYKDYNPHYLRIIVKYLNGKGFIITAYFVEHLT